MRRIRPRVRGVGGLILGLALLLLVVFLAIPKLTEQGTVKVNVGSRTLALGHAEVKAQIVAQDGPIYFQDPSGGDNDIYVQHLGADAKTGWIAFAARPPGTPRECNLRWDKDRSVFVNQSDCPALVVPADGGTLPHYQVTIDSDLQMTLHLDQPVANSTPGSSAAGSSGS